MLAATSVPEFISGRLSDDIELKTGSLKAHWYGMMVSKKGSGVRGLRIGAVKSKKGSVVRDWRIGAEKFHMKLFIPKSLNPIR